MRVHMILITGCLVSACVPSIYSESLSGLSNISRPQPGYGINRVVEKERPVTLIGADGWTCRTTPGRFAATKVGSWADCNWVPAVR